MRWKLIAVTALFLWISAAASFAADMEVMLIPAGTEEEMNRYELPDHKGFLTNLKSGDTEAVVAAFSFDDGLSYELYRDGEQVAYVNEMLIQASGSYEMRVFSSYGEDRAWASFPFTITEFDAAYLEEFQFGKVIEQPEMEMKFHRAEGKFEFFFPNGQSFRATVPDGGVTRGEVSLTVPDHLTAVVKYEDSIVTGDSHTFWKPGNYMVMLSSMPDLQGRSVDYNTYVKYFYFRIIPERVNDMEVMNAPAGFYIRSVTRNGAGIKPGSREYYRMERDGRYRFVLGSEKAGVEYTLELEKDTVAPVIHFKRSYGRFGDLKSVSYSIGNQDAAVKVKLNGDYYMAPSGELTDGGVYILSVEDRAGNVREYRVTIPYEREFSTKNTIIVTFMILLAISGFMIYARRNMRVI
ncbi:MAG: hypothetical protein KHX84_11655 [Enterocloster asparagiformis]|nr:hypothetical protein [Enterocloster asparagiformis]